MNVRNIVQYNYSIAPVFRILTFNIRLSEKKSQEKTKSQIQLICTSD